MPSDHSSKQYDMDLEAIRSKVLLMGGLVESQFSEAMTCFGNGDVAHADKIIKADENVNRMEVSLDDICSHVIVKRQPAANDLRTVVATLKVRRAAGQAHVAGHLRAGVVGALEGLAGAVVAALAVVTHP